MTSPQAPQSMLDYYSSVEQGSNRRFDLQLAATAKQAKAELDNRYRIARLQAATSAEQLAVDKWYKEQQAALAQKVFEENVRQFDKTYGLQEADTTGWFGGQATLKREELDRRYGLDRDTFGLDVAKTAADLRSRPDMAWQFQQFRRDVPALLGANWGARSAATGQPQGQTIAGTLGEVGMGGLSPDMAYLSAAAPSEANDPALAAIGKQYRAGFDKLGAQTFEGMDTNDLGFLKSGTSFIGGDFDQAMRKYLGSRLGQ